VDEKYQEKRAVWLECLCGKDQHSIHSQIGNMLWNTAVFKVVNEARRLSPEAKEGGVQVNGAIHNLIDYGYFTMQAMAIRRLIDEHPLHGNKAVYSLKRLLIDIRENRQLVTRQNMMAAEGRPYDAEPIRQKHEQYVQEKLAKGENTFWMQDVLDDTRIERRHQDIDKLTGILSSARRPDDTLCEDIIDELDQRLSSECSDIGTHATKFMAHAATPESRKPISDISKDPTLGMLWNAERALIEVADFISVVILGDSPVGGLAVPQYDHLAYIDRPLITQAQVVQLNHVWQEYYKEIQSWNSWRPNNFKMLK
jgi:hypothetical protein